jgi:hypothetical protein
VTAIVVWAQRCSCGGQGDGHRSAEHHEPVGSADVDPFAGRACPLCGDYVTGPCLECAAGAIVAVARARALHRPVTLLGQAWCDECSTQRSTGPRTAERIAYIPHPCPTIRALDGEAS